MADHTVHPLGVLFIQDSIGILRILSICQRDLRLRQLEDVRLHTEGIQLLLEPIEGTQHTVATGNCALPSGHCYLYLCQVFHSSFLGLHDGVPLLHVFSICSDEALLSLQIERGFTCRTYGSLFWFWYILQLMHVSVCLSNEIPIRLDIWT